MENCLNKLGIILRKHFLFIIIVPLYALKVSEIEIISLNYICIN